jgi:hypothetical protein
MKEGLFWGSSDSGSFSDALSSAIKNAKQGLNRNYVEWYFRDMRGEHGGVDSLNILEIQILAYRGPKRRN